MKEKLTKMVIDAVYFSLVILLAVGSAYQGSEFCKTNHIGHAIGCGALGLIALLLVSGTKNEKY